MTAPMLIRLTTTVSLGALLWLPHPPVTAMGISPASWALLILTGISILLTLMRIAGRSMRALFLITLWTVCFFVVIYVLQVANNDPLAARDIEEAIWFIAFFGFLLSLAEMWHRPADLHLGNRREDQDHDELMDDADATR